MKRFFTKYGLPVLLAGVGLQVSAEEIFRYSIDTAADFADAFTVQDKNEDGVTWAWHEYKMNGHEYQYGLCFELKAESYNDWLTTQAAFNLKKGTAYRLSFQGWTDTGTYTTTLKAGYVPTSDKEAFVELFSKIPEFPNKYQGETPEQFDIDFEVPEDGYYHLVFISEGTERGGGSAVDNIVISENGSPLSPASSTGVTAKADASFALKATVTFTLPEKTVTGADLPSDGISKVEIYRGETLAGTITEGLTPGATLNWTDENAAAGENEYSVVAYNGELKGAEAKTSVYVGPLSPFSPTNVSAKKAEGGKILVTWTAPTESEEGVRLDDSLIGYNIYRSVNGAQPISVAKNVFATQYEDTFSSDLMAEIVYSVEAVYGPNISESVAGEIIRIGSYPLPYEESFADASTLADWEFTTSDTSTYSPRIWERRERMTSSPYAEPFDADGGLLAYNSYNASTGLRSEAITPEIRIKDASNLTLEFYFHHSTEYRNDQVVVKVSKDGGEFVALEDGTLVRKADNKEWKKYEFSLSDYADATTIRVAFEALSDYGADMAIDAIRVYSGKAFDLKAQSLVSEPTAATGTEAEFLFTLKNVAFSEVKGDAYKVNVYAEGSLLSVLDGVDVAPQQTADFDFKVPVHAGHVEMGMPVYAEIVFAEDEDPENNTSSEIIVDVLPYTAGQSIQKVNGKIEGDNLLLSWDDVEVDQYDKVESEITLDREEDYLSPEMFKEDNSAAWPAKFTAIDGQSWRNIDNDGIESASEYKFPAAAKAFMYDSNEHRSNDMHYDYSHEKTHGMLVAVAPDVNMGQASDYLISPMLPGKGNHRLEFMAKSYSMMTPADFYVEYTTESSYSPAELEGKFIAVGEKVSIPYENNQLSGKWMPYVFEIPADAKYVAIHFVGTTTEVYDKWGDLEKHVSILCLDNIKLVSEQSSKPVYNVYYREYTDQTAENVKVAADATVTNAPKRHNENQLESAGYTVPVPVCATDFHVSCVYPEGETALSAPYRFNFSTGIESVTADLNVSVKVEDRNISAWSEGSKIKVSVYALDGSVVAAEVYEATVPTAGAYIVKAGARTVKIIVR